MNRTDRIKALLIKQAAPVEFIDIQDESSLHKYGKGDGTHLKIYLVTPIFSGLSRLDRQRWFHRAVQDEFDGILHAVSVKLLTPEEWKTEEATFNTPVCKSF